MKGFLHPQNKTTGDGISHIGNGDDGSWMVVNTELNSQKDADDSLSDVKCWK